LTRKKLKRTEAATTENSCSCYCY